MHLPATVRDALVPRLPSEPATTALVLIEFMHGHMHEDHGAGRVARERGIDTGWFYERCRTLSIPTAVRLATALRDAGGTVLATSTGTLFGDYRDVSPGVRPVIRDREHAPGTTAVEVLPEVKDLVHHVVRKSGSGAWATTSIDDILRNAGITTLLFGGVHTHGAVLMSAHWAWDLGYDVTVVDEACATLGRGPHERALDVMRGLGIHVESASNVLRSLGVHA